MLQERQPCEDATHVPDVEDGDALLSDAREELRAVSVAESGVESGIDLLHDVLLLHLHGRFRLHCLCKHPLSLRARPGRGALDRLFNCGHTELCPVISEWEEREARDEGRGRGGGKTEKGEGKRKDQERKKENGE